MKKRPAILGGPPGSGALPISQPTLPEFGTYVEKLREIFASRQITNDRFVRQLEEEAARYLGVNEVVAVSSATSGLILVAKLLGLRGRVLLPSFTFPATLHILLWNQLEPVVVDCDPETFNLDPLSVKRALDGTVCAITPVYIFGNSPDWSQLAPIVQGANIRCFSDAAHALGTRLGDRMAGSFGDAEVFSLAPTKVTVAGEGGLVATASAELARDLRVARNYGNPGDYDCEVAGLNARMSELHALLAVLSLQETERNIERRTALVRLYREGLEGVPGIRFQRITDQCRSTYNYFAIRVRAKEFGLTNRDLKLALDAEGIHSKIYFHPPLHRQTRFMHLPGLKGAFPGTEQVCDEVLCLPLYSHMERSAVDRVVEAVRGCREHASAILDALRGGDAGS